MPTAADGAACCPESLTETLASEPQGVASTPADDAPTQSAGSSLPMAAAAGSSQSATGIVEGCTTDPLDPDPPVESVGSSSPAAAPAAAETVAEVSELEPEAPVAGDMPQSPSNAATGPGEPEQGEEAEGPLLAGALAAAVEAEMQALNASIFCLMVPPLSPPSGAPLAAASDVQQQQQEEEGEQEQETAPPAAAALATAQPAAEREGAASEAAHSPDAVPAVAVEPAQAAQCPTSAAGAARRELGPQVVRRTLEGLLRELGLTHTLAAFQDEWHAAAGEAPASPGVAPAPSPAVAAGAATTAPLSARSLPEVPLTARGTLPPGLAAAGGDAVAAAAAAKLLRERDALALHYRRVVQERNKLTRDLRALKRHYSQYEPALAELRRKYEAVFKEKTLATIQRERLAAQLQQLGAALPAAGAPAAPVQAREVTAKPAPSKKAAASPTARRLTAATALPAGKRRNPHEGVVFEPAPLQRFAAAPGSLTSHSGGVTALALHPSKPVGASGDGGGGWVLWHLEGGERIMSAASAHPQGLRAVAFHPKGTSLATGGAEGAVKLWSFERQCCTAMLGALGAAVTGLAFHDCGQVVAAGYEDGAQRLWDGAGSCLQTLRGHAGPVTGLAWQPYTNTLATCGADGTVCVWDARSNKLLRKLTGGTSGLAALAFSLDGGQLAAVDAAGGAVVWNARSGAQIAAVPAAAKEGGGAGCTSCAFDHSGRLLVVGTTDGRMLCYQAATGALVAELAGGHAAEQAVRALGFDCSGQVLCTAGGDGAVRAWRAAAE